MGRRESHKQRGTLIHREGRTLKNFVSAPCLHNPATPCPHSRPNRAAQSARNENQRMGMTDQDNAASERQEIAAHVARFRATQEKFKREREEYFVTTLENARHTENTRRAFKPPPFWS